MAYAPAIYQHNVGGQVYAALVGGHAALKAGISLINAGVYVGQAAWNTFFNDANDFIERSVDKVSDLDVFVGHGNVVENDTEKVLQRASNNLALLRRYTRRSGVQEKVQEPAEPQVATVHFRCRWHHIRGLAPDEVFLVQKIRVRWANISNTRTWQGLIVGRPWGRLQWTGDRDNNELYPPEGSLYDSDSIGIHTFEDFWNNTRMNWIFSTSTGSGAQGQNYDIDLSPNFIPLRAYQILTEDGSTAADESVVMLEGKTVKWLLPTGFNT